MAKYEIEYWQMLSGSFTVEADSWEQANEKIWAKVGSGEINTNRLAICDSGTEYLTETTEDKQ